MGTFPIFPFYYFLVLGPILKDEDADNLVSANYNPFINHWLVNGILQRK